MTASKDQRDKLFEKWVEWLSLVEEDVYDLHVDRRVWKDIASMIEDNEGIPEREFVKSWITRQYIEAMAMGIRRQTEAKDDVVTTASLLDAIRRNPHVISRERFVELCSPGDDENWVTLVEQHFDKWAGPGGDHVDPALVEQRVKSLTDAAENIRQYVNKKLAHAAKKPPAEGFTFGEIDAALDAIGAVLMELYLLLTCKSLTSPEPTIQNPWRRAFTVPWLLSDEVER